MLDWDGGHSFGPVPAPPWHTLLLVACALLATGTSAQMLDFFPRGLDTKTAIRLLQTAPWQQVLTVWGEQVRGTRSSSSWSGLLSNWGHSRELWLQSQADGAEDARDENDTEEAEDWWRRAQDVSVSQREGPCPSSSHGLWKISGLFICSTQTKFEPVKRLKMIQLMTCKQHCPFKPTRNVHLFLDKGGKVRHNI